YLLGILSRENGLMVPMFALVYHFALRKKIPWKPFAIYGSIAGIYILMRKLEVIGGMGLKEPVKTSIFERMPGFFVAYASYFKLLIAPFNLHMEYLRPMFSWSDPRAVVGMLLFIATIVVAVLFRKRKPYVTFGILWFLVGLFPVANVFVVVNAYMAEHWLYIPVMGLLMIVAHLLFDLTTKRKALMGPVVVIVTAAGLFLGVRTFQQNKTWLNQIAFYERTREFAPNSGRLHADLGEAYYRVGRVEDARDSTIRAIQLRPTYYAAWSNLGTIYMRLGELAKAIDAYEKSLAIRPNYFNAHFNLGNLYKSKGNYDKAIYHYEQAIGYMPSLTEAYNNLAISYNQKSNLAKQEAVKTQQLGDNKKTRRLLKESKENKEKAIEFYKKGIAMQPKNTKFYNNLASAYSDLGRHKEAVDLYNQALQLEAPAHDKAVIYYNLALGYHRLKDQQNFILAFQNANSIPLQSAPVYQQLSSIYAGAGLKSEAKILQQKAQAFKSNPVKGKP
ncbi:MAG: tetratricopeptide repeat protein, partial [Candidatus Omnitrophica bacterium]|nr:tetratricopeptide repeat protein [Candidatus Omnitrophota bacterium]